jgi:hypothetical protein
VLNWSMGVEPPCEEDGEMGEGDSEEEDKDVEIGEGAEEDALDFDDKELELVPLPKGFLDGMARDLKRFSELSGGLQRNQTVSSEAEGAYERGRDRRETPKKPLEEGYVNVTCDKQYSFGAWPKHEVEKDDEGEREEKGEGNGGTFSMELPIRRN